MFKKLYGIKVLRIGIALIGGLLLGTYILSATPTLAINSRQSNQTDNYVIKVNQNGETYGSMAKVKSVEEEPDLILARGVDGTTGYIKKVDLNKDLPRNPEEAAAYMINFNNNDSRRIPLYAFDGKTVIGEYQSGVPQTDKSKMKLDK